MSTNVQSKLARKIPAAASVFAALGDATRLAIVGRLSDGSRRSIAELTEGAMLTRQAITKHLRVLENARLVSSQRAGRENRFVLNPKPIEDIGSVIRLVSGHWDCSLSRLKS
ncbi:MAG: metalloregulator ArsR/SmtB family transcription factor, partial [Rhodanobacteraceae bacterium]